MKKILLTVSLVLFVAGFASAAAINPNRPFDNGYLGSLQGVADDVFGSGAANVVDDQSSVALWTPAEGAVDSYLVTLMDTVTDYYGIYSAATGARYQFSSASQVSFSINDAGDLWVGGTMQIAGFGNAFGFWVQNTYTGEDGGKIYYTEDSKNTGTGHTVQALTYLVEDGASAYLDLYNGGTTVVAQGNNDWVVAFESWATSDNGDFNDVVLYVEDMSPVPEPTTLLLLGSGLIGLAYLKRRKS